jgi:MEMO1 family protein
MSPFEKPLLRPLDFQNVTYQGQSMWLLRDPLRLSEVQLVLPEGMAPMLTLLDGTRTPDEINRVFCRMVGQNLEPQIVMGALEQLDDAFLLENANTARAKQVQLAAYRAQPFRTPALAGHGYPNQPQELSAYLAGFENGKTPAAWSGRGIVSPHIDYDRGGQVYSQVWHAAKDAVADAELVIILGTDHFGGLGTITLTRQAYATPFGVLPPDLGVVEELAGALGDSFAFADELNHSHEHSIELSAVWLHYMFNKLGTKPCPVVPILIGSFQHLVANGGHPEQDARFGRFLNALRDVSEGRRVLMVSSVDLAHMGPVFGDPFPMDKERRDDLARSDTQLMASAVQGDADGWFEQIATVKDRNRICGFSPTYFLLRHLGATTGQRIAYQHCPADTQDASLVSICGLLLD